MDSRKLLRLPAANVQQGKPERLTRWIIAKNDDVSLFGVACMAYEVFPIPPDAEGQDEYRGEDIPVFLGYAALIDRVRYPDPPHHPPIPPLALLRDSGFDAMKPLFTYLSRRWSNNKFKSSYEPSITDYAEFPLILPNAPTPNNLGVQLEPDTQDATHIRLWPFADSEAVWHAASEAAFPVTICVGVGDEREAKRLRFQQVVLRSDSDGREIVPRGGQSVAVRWESVNLGGSENLPAGAEQQPEQSSPMKPPDEEGSTTDRGEAFQPEPPPDDRPSLPRRCWNSVGRGCRKVVGRLPRIGFGHNKNPKLKGSPLTEPSKEAETYQRDSQSATGQDHSLHGDGDDPQPIDAEANNPYGTPKPKW